MTPTPPTLSKRQLCFIAEYLVDLNATQAAIRAGYAPKYANRHAHRMLQQPEIAEHLLAEMAARAERIKLQADDVLLELAYLATSDVRHFRVNGGDLELAENAPPHAWRAVSSVKAKSRTIPQKEGPAIVEHEVEFRLWDKNSALKMAGEHLGLYRKIHEHRAPGGGVLIVPGAVAVDSWAVSAAAQQAALEAKAKGDAGST